MPQTRRSLRTWGSVRLRLTAWYVLLLGLTLLLFSFYLHLRLERSLAVQMDDALQVAASQVLAMVSEDQGHPAFGTTDAAQTVIRRLTQAGFAVRLTAPDGTVWDGFGEAQNVPAGPPRVPGWISVEVEDEPPPARVPLRVGGPGVGSFHRAEQEPLREAAQLKN